MWVDFSVMWSGEETSDASTHSACSVDASGADAFIVADVKTVDVV